MEWILQLSILYRYFCCFLAAGHPADPNATLSDHLLMAVLNLLKKEVSEHGRHLQQYFHLFLMYSNLGVAEVCMIYLDIFVTQSVSDFV